MPWGGEVSSTQSAQIVKEQILVLFSLPLVNSAENETSFCQI